MCSPTPNASQHLIFNDVHDCTCKYAFLCMDRGVCVPVSMKGGGGWVQREDTCMWWCGLRPWRGPVSVCRSLTPHTSLFSTAPLHPLTWDTFYVLTRPRQRTATLLWSWDAFRQQVSSCPACMTVLAHTHTCLYMDMCADTDMYRHNMYVHTQTHSHAYTHTLTHAGLRAHTQILTHLVR